MPLTVALHCSMVKKPQFEAPPALPEYWAHQRVLSQGSALAGVCVSITDSTPSAAILVAKRIASLLVVTRNNDVGSYFFPALAFSPIPDGGTTQ
jgi:hypothetical protein